MAAGAWLSLTCPALAQAPASVPSPPASNAADPTIVVTAPPAPVPGEKKSEWKRADGDNVVVFSDGSAEQLQRVTQNLERLHALLVRLYRPRGSDIVPPPLRVVLFGSASTMRDLSLPKSRFGEGPYARPFVAQRFYDRRPEGDVLALARVDQIIEMNTNLARSTDCDDLASIEIDCTGVSVFHTPLTRTWESVLYGAYAQHLMITFTPIAYPRWYFDGIGALFSTVVFNADGSIDYGRPPPQGYRAVLRSYGPLDTASVLTGDYLRAPSTKMEWTPYHAGLITHYFVLSNLKSDERTRFARYMTAVAQGKPMAVAAQAFGTMSKLKFELLSYAGRNHEYAKTAKGEAPPPPAITPLSQRAADALLASLVPHS
jgi:hypothetical protein